MNIQSFIKTHKEQKTIDSISGGFQKSQFCESIPIISDLVKTIMNTIISNYDNENLLHGSIKLHSANSKRSKLINTLPIDKETSKSKDSSNQKESKKLTIKKQSFCTEFNQMMTNILGLLGFEFSKYLYALFGIKIYIHKFIEAIKQTNNYEEINDILQKLYNMMTLENDSCILNDPLISNEKNKIDPNSKQYVITLDETYFNKTQQKWKDDVDEIDYFHYDIEDKNITSIIKQIIKNVSEHIKIGDIKDFEEDRTVIYNKLIEIYNHLKFGTYYVNDVDDLVINLGDYNVCYDKSFLKLYDLLYRESFVDVPPELWHMYRPTQRYIDEEIKSMIKSSKYIARIEMFYKNRYDAVVKSLTEDVQLSKEEFKLDLEDMMNVEITNEMYDRLANLTLNLYVCIAKKIAYNQIVYSYFGKSTRIQLMQVFLALMNCVSQLSDYSSSQICTLHYVLLTDKNIKDYIDQVGE